MNSLSGNLSDAASNLTLDNVSKTRLVDQLRQNVSLDSEAVSKVVNNSIIKNLLNSPQTQELLVNATIDESIDSLHAKDLQQKVYVYQRLSKEDQDRLRRSFDMFNLDFTRATDCSGHPFWRAHRLLSEKKMIRQAGVRPGSRPVNGYDVVYKDVGGNPTTHLNRGEMYVHTCAPLLSNSDDKRHSAYKERLRRETCKKKNEVYAMHLERNSQVICNRRSQNCCIKAEVLIFLHSTYDMSLVDIANSMHRADARTAYGCFHFNPRLLYEKEGKLLNGMFFKKIVVNGRVKIRFWYENDNQEGYEHDFLSYLSLVRTFRISSTAQKPRHYNVQFDTTDDDTAFFVIRQSINGTIPRSHPFRVFTNTELSDKMLVYSWHWDTINPGNFSASVFSRMRPVRLIVPRKLFYKMCSFADTLPESKFTVKNILIAGTSFNTREVISGQSIGVVDPIEPSALKMLAVTVFVITYISNYESSKTMSAMVDDEKRVRDESDSGFFSRMFRVKNRLPWNNRVQKFRKKMSDLTSEMSTFEEKLSAEDDPATSRLKKVVGVIRDCVSVERRFKIVIEKMCNFLTVEEELDCLTLADVPCDRGFVSDNPLSEFIDPETVRDAVVECLENVKITETLYDSSSYTLHNCSSDLEPVPNNSNGDCVFQSMIDSGVCKDMTPRNLRNHLLNSSYLNNLRNSVHQKRLLGCFDGSRTGFGDLDTFILFSLEFQQGVCIHINGQNKIFGSVPYRHFLIENDHCSYLKPSHNFDSIPTYTLVNNVEEFVYSSQARDLQFESFFNLRSQYSRAQYNKRLALAKRNYCPLSELGDGNYVCRSGLKTAEMFARYFTSEHFSAVSIGGPGGEVQFLCEKGIRTFGVTKTDLIDFSPVVRNHLFTQLLGQTYDGDIMKIQNILSFRDDVRALYPAGVCFFGGDAATTDPQSDNVDVDHMSELISWEILCMTVTLRKGGDAYFKVVDLLSNRMLKNLYFLSRNFSRFEIVKLETSRSASTELHVICRDFLLEDTVPGLAHSQLLASHFPVPKSFYHNMCHAQKYFDDYIVKGLREYRRAFDTAGERNEHVNRFPEEKIEGYRNVLCLPVRVSAGGIVSAVRRTFQRIYSDVNSVSRDFEFELRNYRYVDVDTISVESFSTAVEDLDEDDVVVVAEEGCAEEAVEIFDPVAESVSSYFGLFSRGETAPEKPDPFLVSTEDDGSFTEMGQTRPTGITIVAPLINHSKPSFELRSGCVPVSDEPEEVAAATPAVVESPVTYRDAMKECLELTKFTLASQVSNHDRVLRRIDSMPLASTFTEQENGAYSYMVYSNPNQVRVRFGNPVGDRKFNKFFFRGAFHPTKEMNNILSPGDHYLVSEYCEIALEQELISTYKSIDIDSFEIPNGSGIVQAGPGCGKTTFVVNNTVPPHMPEPTNVLLATIEGKEDFISRLEKKYGRKYSKQQLVHIRTLASFLVNTGKNVRSPTLVIDEALMSHPGQIFFAIALSGAKEVKLLGDMLQIPFVNRTPEFRTKCNRLSMFVPVIETLYVSYRCPSDVVARLNSKYLECNIPNGVNYGLLSTKYAANTCKLVRLSNDNFPKDHDVQYLVFTQPEKTKLLTMKLKVSTVHEFQGKEAKHIRVVRLNPFPQTEIFHRFSYALVALTRHTESLTYYTRVTSDALSKLIKVDGITTHLALSEDENRKCLYVSAGGAAVEVFRIANDHPVSSLSTMSVVSSHISRIQDTKLYFVPRFGRKPDCKHKPLVMNSDVCVSHSNGHLNFFVVSSESHAQKHNLSTLTRNLRKLSLMLVEFGVSRLYVSGEVEKDVDRASLGYAMYKHVRAKSFLCSVINQYDVPSEVFDLMTKNGICDLPNSKFDSIGFEISEYIPVFKIQRDFSVESAQSFVNSFFGECAYVDQSYDGWDVRNGDLNIEIGDVSFAPVGCVQLNRQFDCMRPLLKTPMPHMRDYNMRELTLALEKRNRNVPFMNGVVDYDSTSSAMLESLVRECFDSQLLDFHRTQPVTISLNSIGEWLSGQPTPVRNMIVPDFALHCTAINSYTFSIKRKPKPNLTIDAANSYLALQTIVYHEKPINAMFCSVFRELKRRITYSLKPHVKIFCDMSAEDFEDVMNRDVPPSQLSPFLEKLEIDISKYDKSQRELALEFECKLMRYFGVSDDIIELWFNAHVLTEIYDKTTKLKALIPYQRKSGDASTFIGNTLFLMAVVCHLIPVSKLELAVFSGDDSLLYGYGMKRYQDSQHFGLTFNLEIKFFEFEYSYFCSKFLLVVNDRWTFTPCPVKFMTKLGRHDLVNQAHVEEYRISFIDTTRNYSNYYICMAVAKALKERYGIVTDHTEFLSSLSDMTSRDNFSKLFYSEVGDRIDESVVFSREF
ncbi:putative RNA-dependent RNA polymerase [Ying Kou virus]|uniref:Putative RNA-dependent RNA polymerase n=1 Tax=Ying Kou virus TaxID=2479372 RepID=A0A3G1Z324_9VIRU|nr:putative RNA-dependent RNA polymerase [Ying Kou virus]AYL60135.1 putative RNA-dependent RNA polymerase [Ying Kou virus]